MNIFVINIILLIKFLLNTICANKIPHITAYTINDGKPVDSNYITHWIPITPITVFAKLDCVFINSLNF